MRFHKASSYSASRPGLRKAFSLVEVVLAVGVLAVSVLALLGMMGPAFRQAKNVTETNAATAVIGKLNSVLQAAEFTDIYTIVRASSTGGGETSSAGPNPNSVGILLFYTEEYHGPQTSDTRFRDRVAYRLNSGSIANASKYGWQSLNDLHNAITPSSSNNWHVVTPIVAVVLSLSPMVKDIPNYNTVVSSYTEASPYASNTASRRLLPTYNMPSDSDTYTLGMLPITASVFVIPNPIDSILGANFDSSTAYNRDFITLDNRVLTFQAVKLR